MELLPCNTCQLGQETGQICGRVGGMVLAQAECTGHSTSEDPRSAGEVAADVLARDVRLHEPAKLACGQVFREVADVTVSPVTV